MHPRHPVFPPYRPGAVPPVPGLPAGDAHRHPAVPHPPVPAPPHRAPGCPPVPGPGWPTSDGDTTTDWPDTADTDWPDTDWREAAAGPPTPPVPPGRPEPPVPPAPPGAVVPPAPPMPPYGPGFGFGPPGFGPGGFRRGGPRVRRGDVRAAVLALLAEQPRNGYQLIREIARRSGGVWRPSPGSVYPALSQLTDEDLVTESGSARRREYRLTDAGRRYVDEHPEELAAPWANAAEAVSDEPTELWESLHAVQGAAIQVVQAGTPVAVEAARQVLDGARRDIYRILAGDADDD